MTTSNKNTFKDLDKTFNTKEVTKALERNLKEREEERNKQLPTIPMSDEDRDALLAKQQEEDLLTEMINKPITLKKQTEPFDETAYNKVVRIALIHTHFTRQNIKNVFCG